MKIDNSALELWFVTGSQHLYGEQTLQQVAEHARGIAEGLQVSVRMVVKPIMTTSASIEQLALDANSSKSCVGLLLWMHTFSPSKMWIEGLMALRKPFVHLHTQFNAALPWRSIDMDFMNLNQSAHGDREFGFICTRLHLNRKVVVGFWQDRQLQHDLDVWTRAACAWHEAQHLKVARFGDNMRNVAVTEGNKVNAQISLRYSVHGYGIGDLVARVRQVPEDAVARLVKEYRDTYTIKGSLNQESLTEAARIELGLREFLEEGSFKAFTDTFEDLHGMHQLPGIAVQRLMADGYGFGGEGDWKTAALVRSMKVMAAGLPGGTSFMEDYTYHLEDRSQVLGAHMLEVCPSISRQTPSLEVHPLGIGGKADPARLVFTADPGAAVNASVIDLGHRFRMIVNDVEVVAPPEPLPKLPVARALWHPKPDLRVAASAWILAGGAHHTGFSQALTIEHMTDFAEMAGIELVHVHAGTTIAEFKKELRWNEIGFARI